MRNLFRAFRREGVRYLLIGGQATLLYGATDQTQDTDLWIDPTAENLDAMIRALAKLGAAVYKLTPPLTVRNLRRGHGFHFRIGRTYLDVMGRPPDAPPFAAARRRAVRMKTVWGTILVASIEDLVETKKTNRFVDYDVITRLVRIRGTQDRWAARHTFRVDAEAGSARLTRRLSSRVATLMEKRRRYWLPRIRELRELRARGELLAEGLAVRRLLTSRSGRAQV